MGESGMFRFSFLYFYSCDMMFLTSYLADFRRIKAMESRSKNFFVRLNSTCVFNDPSLFAHNFFVYFIYFLIRMVSGCPHLLSMMVSPKSRSFRKSSGFMNCISSKGVFPLSFSFGKEFT